MLNTITLEQIQGITILAISNSKSKGELIATVTNQINKNYGHISKDVQTEIIYKLQKWDFSDLPIPSVEGVWK